MNFTSQNSQNLIAHYLKEARERLETARMALEIGNLADSISRSYYAILDAATACLIKKDIIPKSHEGAIDQFSLHYIKTGLVDKKYIRYFKKIKKARIDADYHRRWEFTKEETEEVYQMAREFVEMAVTLL